MYAWLRVVFYALYLARTRLCGCTCIHFKHEYVRARSHIHLNILYTRVCCARVVGIACVVGRAQRREIRQVLLSFLATPSRLRNKYPTFNTAWATERHAQRHAPARRSPAGATRASRKGAGADKGAPAGASAGRGPGTGAGNKTRPPPVQLRTQGNSRRHLSEKPSS